MPEAKKLVSEILVPEKSARAFLVKKGQYLRVIDPQGGQVADTVFFNSKDLAEKFRCAYTRMASRRALGENGTGKLDLTTGDTLYSGRHNAMFTITEDTYGLHDCGLTGMCSKDTYINMGVGPRNGCRENFFEAMQSYGVKEITDIPDPFTFFMTTKVDSAGRITITGPDDKPGDYVELRAEMDCIVCISACPNDIDPKINRGKCKPILARIYD